MQKEQNEKKRKTAVNNGKREQTRNGKLVAQVCHR